MGSLNDLIVYKKAFNLAMDIFEATKEFPKAETYSLTDQIRRSSRSVCSNMAEAYQKRNYPKHFVVKLSDSNMENSETLCWLKFAKSCNYLSEELYLNFCKQNSEIGRLLTYMERNPQKFIWQNI